LDISMFTTATNKFAHCAVQDSWQGNINLFYYLLLKIYYLKFL